MKRIFFSPICFLLTGQCEDGLLFFQLQSKCDRYKKERGRYIYYMYLYTSYCVFIYIQTYTCKLKYTNLRTKRNKNNKRRARMIFFCRVRMINTSIFKTCVYIYKMVSLMLCVPLGLFSKAPNDIALDLSISSSLLRLHTIALNYIYTLSTHVYRVCVNCIYNK